ncbi:MAG: hypothetical protein J2P47_08925 [Acetobacteraceae bacterium]|nr:hypothetical protein [Acetobacteraceae bacterium]
MNGLARIAGLAALGCTALVNPFGAGIVVGQAPAERLTTDTPEYCSELLQRVQQVEQNRGHTMSKDVLQLSQQGELMCSHGEVRGGILRLRRAMRIILGAEDK